MSLFVRVISSEKCPNCQAYKNTLSKRKFEHVIYDADDDNNQDQLDSWGINEMPVVQIVQNKDNKDIIKFQFGPGSPSPRAINIKIEQIKNLLRISS